MSSLWGAGQPVGPAGRALNAGLVVLAGGGKVIDAIRLPLGPWVDLTGVQASGF